MRHDDDRRGASGDGPASGYTLVEAVVALTLALAVLAPICTFVVRLTFDRRNRHEVEALLLAQRCMEETLHAETFASATEDVQGGAWRVVRRVWYYGDQVTVVVTVFRRRRRQPVLTLTSIRPQPWRPVHER